MLSSLLGGIRVFDGASVPALVDAGTEVTYQPGGIHLLSDLAVVCKQVQAVLASERTSHEQVCSAASDQFAPVLGDHAVGVALRNLAEPDGLRAVEGLAAALSEEEVTRLDLARTSLAALKPANVSAEATRLTNEAKLVRALAERLQAVVIYVSDDAALEIEAEVVLVQETRVAARAAASALKGELLPGTGGEVWRKMWDAAQAYTATHAYPGHSFPVDAHDGLCVLCQQVLGDEARARLLSLGEFVHSTFQSDHDSALAQCSTSRKALAAISALLSWMWVNEPVLVG